MKNYFKHIKSKTNFTKVKPMVKLSLILLIGCNIALFSCESFLEVEPPSNQITGEAVFKNTSTATAALVNIYAGLRLDGLFDGTTISITGTLAHYADELESFGNSHYYDNALDPLNSGVLSTWGNTYNLIYAANAVIERVNNSTEIPQENKDQLIGEALFSRALMHFYLTNLFGDIPYIATSNFQENTQASKMSVAEVYQKIITDLLTAKGLLSNVYISGERTRPNSGVVSALLSRVYLYHEDWENAEQESSLLVGNTGVYTWETDLSKVFLKESRSTIWQFKPLVNGLNTNEASVYIFVSGPPPLTALTNTLIDGFEPGDNRFTNWVGTVTDGTDTWYHVFKYKAQGNTGTSVEYSKQFRLAEQYLIRAEARAMLNDIVGAQSDLNVIRTRAGLGNTTAATTNDLLDAILHERQVEFFVEKGHRFFDLKRMGKADAVLSLVKPGWNTTDALFPIPEEEILVNSNLLPQNPGY
ncbi:MAG: RagB/SusD family nutrient uptake outer membrane protein [Cellulophaga sp.]